MEENFGTSPIFRRTCVSNYAKLCVHTSLQFHSLCLMKCSTAKYFKICHIVYFIYQKPTLIFPCIQFWFWHAKLFHQTQILKLGGVFVQNAWWNWDMEVWLKPTATKLHHIILFISCFVESKCLQLNFQRPSTITN